MDFFDQRERGYEARFGLDQETTFLIDRRRDKLLGLWAARLLGLDGDAALSYAHALVDAGIDHPGDDAVIARLVEGLRDAGTTEDDVRLQFSLKAIEAQGQVLGDMGDGPSQVSLPSDL